MAIKIKNKNDKIIKTIILEKIFNIAEKINTKSIAIFL